MADGNGHGECWWILVIAFGIAVGLWLFAALG